MTELEINEIFPSRKFVPCCTMAAARNVSSSTGISAQVVDVRMSTTSTTTTAMTMMRAISFMMTSAKLKSTSELTTVL